MDKLNELEGYLRQLIGVEMLECEDKSWLVQDDDLRNKNKEELLNTCRLIVVELREEKDLRIQLERPVSVRPGGKPLDFDLSRGEINCGGISK